MYFETDMILIENEGFIKVSCSIDDIKKVIIFFILLEQVTGLE